MSRSCPRLNRRTSMQHCPHRCGEPTLLSLPHLKLLFWDPERCFLEHSVHDKRNRSPSRDIRDIFITATPEHKSDAHTNSRFRYIRKHGVLGEEPMLNAARVKGTRECGCQGELLSSNVERDTSTCHNA